MKELIYTFWMLVGTYTGGESEGIYVYGFDPESARTVAVGSAEVENPSYMTVSADGAMVYAVSENGGGTPSLANAFKFDAATGGLAFVGGVGTGGVAPCNIATNGRIVVTANYGSGDMSVFGVEPGGGLTTLRQRVDVSGGSPGASHVHCVKFSPCGRWLFASDLGRDRILRFDVVDGRLDEGSEVAFDLPAGSGPRHFVFDAAGRNLYLINERSGTVIVFRYRDGRLERFQEILADTAGGHGSADIVLSADGRHLYASNRLKGDGVAIFAVDTATGALTPAGYQPTGIHPRNLSLTPGGGYLAVAARDSGTVEFYAIDPATGALTPRPEATVSLDKPVCVTFLPREAGTPAAKSAGSPRGTLPS